MHCNWLHTHTHTPTPIPIQLHGPHWSWQTFIFHFWQISWHNLFLTGITTAIPIINIPIKIKLLVMSVQIGLWVKLLVNLNLYIGIHEKVGEGKSPWVEQKSHPKNLHWFMTTNYHHVPSTHHSLLLRLKVINLFWSALPSLAFTYNFMQYILVLMSNLMSSLHWL